MSMDRLVNALKGSAAALDQRIGQPRFATVISVNPDSYTVRVQLQPENVVTGWLPVLSPWIGAGWGWTAPPAPGDQVLVIPQEGDAEHGVVAGCSFSDAQRPPATPVGEIWITHQTGSSLRLLNDGTVRISGDLHVDGNVYVSNDIADGHGALSSLRVHYDAHTHTDSHGDVTGIPTPQD